MYASCKLTCAKGGHTKSSDQHFLLPGSNYLETILLFFCHVTFVCGITTTYLQKPDRCAGWAGCSPWPPVGSLERGLCSEVLLCPERAPLSAACQVSGQSKTIRFSHSGFKHPKRFFFKSSGLTATILKQDPSTQSFFLFFFVFVFVFLFLKKAILTKQCKTCANVWGKPPFQSTKMTRQMMTSKNIILLRWQFVSGMSGPSERTGKP